MIFVDLCYSIDVFYVDFPDLYKVGILSARVRCTAVKFAKDIDWRRDFNV